jgi:flagellar basal body-associated protein FliL
VPNEELKREMMEKKDQLRGIIYDILREEIYKAKEIPSLKKLKEFIIRGVNIALSTGKVNEVYITKFLAV